MTYGALHVMSPNVSPATGSKRLPSRVSTLSMSFSAALIWVNASARGLTSVATTSSACPAASSACTPFPVPMSSARETCRRGVSDASQYAVGVKLATQPGGSFSPCENVSKARYTPSVGTMRARGTSSGPSSVARPSPHELRARSERRARDRPCEQQQPDRVPELVVLEPARISEGVVGLGCDAVFPEPVLDCLLVVPELAQRLADGAGGVAVG